MKLQSIRLASAILALSLPGILPAAGAPQMVSLVFNSAPQ